MKILCHKQQYTFVDHDGGGQSIAVSPKPEIQTVPDWVRNTSTFLHAAKAGTVVEIAVIPPPSLEAPVPPSPAAPPVEDDADADEPEAKATGRRRGK